jgi:hypothetical protein
LADVERALNRYPQADLVAGSAVMLDSDRPWLDPVSLIAAPGDRLDTRQLALGVPAINAMAFRRQLFERCGAFETTYRAAGDRAFLLRLSLLPTPPLVARADGLLYRYYCHDGSLTLRRNLKQRLMIANEHTSLATALLQGGLDRAAARPIRFWRRREAVVAAAHCLAAGQPIRALGFAYRLLRPSPPLPPPAEAGLHERNAD